jgi:Holliday junction resolvase RusA-like endonuclease
MDGKLDLSHKAELSFVVPGDPTPWMRPRHNSRGPFTRFYNAPKHDKFMRLVRQKALAVFESSDGLWQGPVRAKVFCLFQIPKSRPGYVKRSIRAGRTVCTNRKDVDNLAKIVLDALNDNVYVDDRQVLDLHVRKTYSDNPRLLVKLWHLEGECG